jgi:hypothetical protein
MIKKLIGLLVAALVLSGCAQLPQTGAIGIGPDVSSGQNTDYLYYSPALPSVGATQQDIISGFLSAGNGPQNDYLVARSYLTASEQPKWSPSDEVLVQDGAPAFDYVTADSVRVIVKISASIDKHGAYRVQKLGTTRVLNFKFAKEAGEWRIASAPNLTMLIHPNFQVIFKAFQVYFFDKNHETLVPDVRWLPSRTSTATRLTQAVLAGPQQWLAPALADSAPELALRVNAVTVSNGIASIDLDANAYKVANKQLQFLKAQLKATLFQLPDITGLTISIDGAPQSLTDVAAHVAESATGSPVVLSPAGLNHIGSNVSIVGAQQLSSVVGKPATDFALSAGEANLAVVNADGAYILNRGSLADQPMFVDSRPHLLSPVWDNKNFLWTISSALASTWLATSANGETSVIVAPNYSQSQVKSFSISPDGSRAAIISTGKRSGLWIVPIIRKPDGAPSALGVGYRVTYASAAPKSVSWADSVHVAALVKNKDQSIRAVISMIGGEDTLFSPVSGATSIAATISGPYLYVRLADGTVVQSKNSIWSVVASDILAMHYPG